MLAIVKQLKYPSVHVLGHSFGGMLAMGFAVKYPQYLNKLVLCSSAGLNLDFLDYFGANIEQRLTPVVDTLPAPLVNDREEFFYSMLRRNAPAYFFNKEHVPVFIEMLTAKGSYNPDFNAAVWADLFKINYDLSRKLKAYKKPALVVQGRQDIMGDETAIRIHEAINTSKLVFMNQCGHVPWLDQPDEFFKLLEEFLG